MKKALALFLAVYLFVGSLFPGNSFFEFSEIPMLVKHFQYHRTIETPGIGFIDFMVMHYANAEHEKSDPINHNKLPVHHGFTTVISDELVPSKIIIKPILVKLTTSSKLFNNYQPALPQKSSEVIFHPPKV